MSEEKGFINVVKEIDSEHNQDAFGPVPEYRVKYSYSFHVVIANLGQAVRTEYT
jgi:hypothetical protein